MADVCDEGTQVLAIGDVNDIGLYRALIGFGVHDYLVKPIDGRDACGEPDAGQGWAA